MYCWGIETHVTLAKVWVRDPLEDLRRLHERVVEFGGDSDLAYKSHEIPEFLELIEQPMNRICQSWTDRETTDFETYDVDALYIPRNPKIPVVRDWQSTLAIFQRLNQVDSFYQKSDDYDKTRSSRG